MGLVVFIMYVINVVFWLMGGTLLGLGIWMAVDPQAQDTLGISPANDELFLAAVYMMIAVGAFVFVVGFLGWWGACKPGERKCSLILYASIVSFIIVLEIIVVILAAVYWGSITEATQEQMAEDLKTGYVNESSDDALSNSWDKMQSNWQCCGSYNYTDWIGSNYDMNTNNTVPTSCCVSTETDDDLAYCQAAAVGDLPSVGNETTQIPDDYIYTKGCYQALKDYLASQSIIIIAVTCTFAALEIIGLALAFVLLCDDEGKKKTTNHD